MDEQQLFSERMNGLLDLATDKGGILSKGEIHFYLKDVLQSEDQYEFVYQFFAEKGVRVEGWRGAQRDKTVPGGKAKQKGKPELSGETKHKKKPRLSGETKYNTETGESASDSSGDGGSVAEGDEEEDVSDAEYYEENEDEDDSAVDTDSLPLPVGIDESMLTEDEKRYLKYYQADIDRIEPVTEAERISLLNALAAGDPSVMNRLVEGHLYLVMEEIAAYLHAGVSVGDLIQEASIGLIEGIQSYRGMNFEAHVRYAIREALDAITEEQQASDSVAKHLLDSINRADEATRKLSEDLDRAPTKEELAEYLHMDVDEVETLLKHSIDALTVSVSDEAYGKTDEGKD